MNVLKRQVQRLPLALFFPIYSIWFWISSGVWTAQLRRRLGFPQLSDIDLLQAKESDTVFILGSGRSINDIAPQRWEVIKSNDTIALNNWLVHPFVPKFYCFESPVREPGVEPAYDFLLNNIRRRTADYRHTIKILANLKHCEWPQIAEHIPQEWRQNLYYVDTPEVVARTRKEFTAMVRYYKARGLFAREARVKRLFKYNSVLSTCLSLAIRLGYRRIVLCGVDLWSFDYFYHDPLHFPETASVSVMPREEKHDTVVAKPWLVPIDQMLTVIRDEILEPAGIELFVENTTSLLYPQIPIPPESVFEPATTGVRKRAAHDKRSSSSETDDLSQA